MTSFNVKTSRRQEFVDVTEDVRQAVRESGISVGVATVFVPHTTAGITINENADPSVVQDILSTLDRLAPHTAGYAHTEGNADAHIKSSLIGCSLQVLLEGGHLLLGTWQGIFFCEFDGPRMRKVWVKVEGE